MEKNDSPKNSTSSHIYRSKRDVFFILLAFFLFFFILALPRPADLTLHGQRALGVFILALTLWVTSALPLSVTGLLVIAMIPLLQIMEADRAYSFFGNQAVFFILGAFIMAAAMMKSGLSKRMALGILRRFSRNPRILVLGILVTCSSLSLIMPEHAVAALMFPVVSTITLSLHLEPVDIQYGASLFLAMSWGAVIGGIGTLLGGARAPLAIGLLQEAFGQTITFWDWSKVSLPLAGLMLAAAFLVLTLCFHMDVVDVTPAMKKLEEELLEIGPMTQQEKRVLCIMAVTIFTWIFLNQVFGLALVSLLSAVILFMARTITWDDVDSYVNWGVILMYGGAIVLAKAVDQTGAAHWMARRMLGQAEFHPFWILALFAFISLILTEGISNVACVAIILPIGFSLARANAINPLAMTFSIAIPSGLAFILPMGTPSNAIAYSSGFYEIREILKAGLILHICGWTIFLILIKWYWQLIGLGLLLK
ncbi:MAG: SLC13 family permease [bacterium]